uniref:Uncharacterized protein n=1 Tax=Arundo donax TaxID=35708 RepID=A0A0A8ZDL1_ARUDO
MALKVHILKINFFSDLICI